MLTPKQEKFCECIVSGMSAKESYITSYNTKAKDQVIRNEANKLLKRDDITERIQELRKPLQNHAINIALSEREQIKKKLWEMINSNTVSDSDKLRSMDILNRMNSEYININKNIDESKENISQLDTDSLKKLVSC